MAEITHHDMVLSPGEGLRKLEAAKRSVGSMFKDGTFEKKLGAGKLLVPETEVETKRRENELILLFYKWDQEGIGILLPQLNRVFDTLTLPSGRDVANRLAEFVAQGRVPSSGVGRVQFVNLMQEVFKGNSASDFNDFLVHVHNTVNFLNHLTELTRRRLVVWKLFMDWDADRSGILEYDELVSVIKDTSFFTDRNIDAIAILKAFRTEHANTQEAEELEMSQLKQAKLALLCDNAVHEDVLEIAKLNLQADDDQQQAHPESQLPTSTDGVNLNQFHQLINRVLLKVSLQEYYRAVEEITHAINMQKRTYTINKFMKTGLDDTLDTKTAEFNPTRMADMAVIALKEKDRDSDLRIAQIHSLQQEAAHAFDSVNPEDVQQFIELQSPKEFYETVAAPVCLLLKIPPRGLDDSPTEYPYWSAMKFTIRRDFAVFMQCLRDFQTSRIAYTTIRLVMAYYYDAWFDPNRLLMYSWFLSALCQWVKAIVQVACLENSWQYPPPPLNPDDYPHALSPREPRTVRLVPPLQRNRQKGVTTPRLPILENVFKRGDEHELVELPDESPIREEHVSHCHYHKRKTPRTGIVMFGCP